MNLWLTAGSLAAVLALAGIAKLLKLGGPPRVETADEAIAHAEALVSGFEGTAAIVSPTGAALVAGIDAGLVLLEPKGARFRARRLPAASLRASGDGVTLRHDNGTTLQFPADPADIAAFVALAAGQVREGGWFTR